MPNKGLDFVTLVFSFGVLDYYIEDNSMWASHCVPYMPFSLGLGLGVCSTYVLFLHGVDDVLTRTRIISSNLSAYVYIRKGHALALLYCV